MSTSHQAFIAAQKVIPGGVNSPVRAFKGVGGEPFFIDSAKGCHLRDIDGKQYIDYIGSWGPMITGHAHPDVIKAVQLAAEKGLSYGIPSLIETQMAEKVCELVPSIEMVRMVSSGTEATMSAIRLARGYTGRDILVKFEGCYHGHADALLVKAGSGALTLGIPTSLGVPASVAKHTLTLSYNNLAEVQALFERMGDKIAAIIVEPVAGNMNCIPPVAGFLQGLRDVCDQHGSVLIFDEVMTGFRVSLGGAQSYYKVSPDLTTLGKVIGGGMPVGAFGGKTAIMQKLAPLGSVYQAGTLSGNPITMAAGLAMLDLVSVPNFYCQLEIKVAQLVDGILAEAKKANIAMSANKAGGMFGLFFTDIATVSSFEQVNACNMEQFKQFFQGMLKEGVYFAPSAYEAAFISSAHTDTDLDATIAAASRVFATMTQ